MSSRACGPPERGGRARGPGDRVRVTHADVAALPSAEVGEYTLVTAFECVHDMPDPVGVLAVMRQMAGDSGAVMVMDERAAEEFTAPADPVERFLYAASLAGSSGLEVLDVDHDFWRFYRLHR